MLLTHISLKRPVFTIMFMLGLIVMGVFSYFRLPLDELPNVEFPFALVQIVYSGASPNIIEQEVSKPIEEAINLVEGVNEIESNITQGICNIFVEFSLSKDRDTAVQDVRDAIANIRNDLPSGIEEPTVKKYDPISGAIITIGVQSDSLSFQELSNFTKQNLKKRFDRISGVGFVSVEGERERQINTYIDPDALSKKQISINSIVNAIQTANQELPIGEIKNNYFSNQLQIKGRIREPQDLEKVIIEERQNIPIYLRDIARVEDGYKDIESKSFYDGRPIISLEISKIRGSNTIKIADAVIELTKEINDEFQGKINLFVIKDNATDIRASLHELMLAIGLGICITIGVVFLFLNSWRSTIITGLAIPISLITAFWVMYTLDCSINTMTLLALSLSVGLVIDDAIVVRENIIRHIDTGKNYFQAVVDGTKEVGAAVFSSTIVILVVFIPIAFMEGLTGKFFKGFGLVVSFTVLTSLFVAFTLDPVLSNIWKENRTQTKHNKGFFHKIYSRAILSYRKLLHHSLNHPIWIIFVTVILLIGSFALFPYIGGGFLPDQDKSKVNIQVKAPINMPLSFTELKSKQITTLLYRKHRDYIRSIYMRVGGGFENKPNEAFILVNLIPRAERPSMPQKQLMEMFRQDLRNLIGVETEVAPADQGGPPSSPIKISIQGSNRTILNEIANKIKSIASQTPGATDISSSEENNRATLNININRDKISDLGLSISQITETLNVLFAGYNVSQWKDTNGEEFNINLRLPKEHRLTKDNLKGIFILAALRDSPNQAAIYDLVSFDEFAEIEYKEEAHKISRFNLQNQIRITGNNTLPISKVMAPIIQEIKKIELPIGYKIEYKGDLEDMQEALFYAMMALVLSIIFIYFVLASQFNSLIQPIAIMMTLPLAWIGVLVTLFITNDTLNIMSLIGVVTLMGLVTKNGILLIEFANQKRQQGLSLRQSIIHAGHMRLRPILMTSCASALGVLPLALGIGAGAEMRIPMARVIVGGTISSTLLTLFIVPVLYCLLETAYHKVQYIYQTIKQK